MSNLQSCMLLSEIIDSGADELPYFDHFSKAEKFSFSYLLEQYVHYRFSERDAEYHWINILKNQQSMSSKLNKQVNLHTAAVDYFLDNENLLKSPILIETSLLRKTEEQAMTDGLTGLFNRRYMEIALKKEFNRAERYQSPLSVIMIDIDFFKQLNDSKGHVFGDLVLETLSQIIKHTIREEDIPCRFGGEEFLLILPETNEEGVSKLAERIRENVKLNSLFAASNITFSAGIATFPFSAHSIESLIEAVDKALYTAKNTGRNKTIQANSEDRRKFGRMSKELDVELYLGKNKQFISGIITKNISTGGVQFGTTLLFPVDTDLQMTFLDPGNHQKTAEAKGKISWVKKTRSGYLYGANFLEQITPIAHLLSVKRA